MNGIEILIATILLAIIAIEGIAIKELFKAYRKMIVKEELLIGIIEERHDKDEREDPDTGPAISSRE